ncbi:FAD-binding oxidoreductase [Metabacillus litoralis]|uniref:FAD-binding oxidoreductase n=1 Tax=Metabacillus litoralis TaxID=152268 RepID=A0A5C6W5C8_9BACI|nr:FAD-binding oxidoreductase [Metabacillus litoralis]TXC93001.1 FAD-binding oxidoreductase [Metabacillus litoralis]
MPLLTKIAQNPWFLGMLVLLFTAVVFLNIPIEKRKYGLSQSNLTTDYTGLLPEKIHRVVQTKNRNEIQEIVKEANATGKKISIAGLQHSQGGHTYYKDGIVIDMKTFNKVLEVDEKNKTVRVESGATWEDVQEAIIPYGLALKVTQSQSIFTIGGSLSVNAHGRDIHFGSMASTVKEMTLLTPTGEIIKLNRNDQEEWMKYVLGGYGLFGVILDVTVELTDNNVYTIQTKSLKSDEYESYFRNILDSEKTAMHYARISVAPKSFLDEMYVIDYNETGKTDNKTPLKKDQAIRLSKLALDVGRQGGLLEDLFWSSQKHYIQSLDGKKITRNNAMRSESTFMEYTKTDSVEVLQEFFIPVENFDEYMTSLKKLLPSNDKNEDFKIHNITVRYVMKDNKTSLNYAREDMLGLVVLIQHGVKKKSMDRAKEIIKKWTDLTLEHSGTYYLPYYPYQSKEQFNKSYPELKSFRIEKRRRDPNEVFQNVFYENYLTSRGKVR